MAREAAVLMRKNLRTSLGTVLLVAGVAAAGIQGSEASAALNHASGSQAASMSFGGLNRTYRIYAPHLISRTTPVPLILVLHGGGGTGEGMEKLTLGGLNRLADRDGFVVAYPDGVGRTWNDGRTNQQYRAQRESIDDVGFIAALIAHLAQTLPIDRGRVYATGISNGGLMALRLARELADRVAAIAPVAASMSDQIVQMRAPARPISVLLIAGTKDPLVPFSGGDIGFARGRKVGHVISVAETIRYWAAFDHCPSTRVVTLEPDTDPRDGTRVRREAYGPCREGTEVVFYEIDGGGHTWPGGLQYLPEWIIGKTSRDIDANAVIWSFLKKHTLH
jgi:polyhydroxybutyrate depolymerase